MSTSAVSGWPEHLPSIYLPVSSVWPQDALHFANMGMLRSKCIGTYIQVYSIHAPFVIVLYLLCCLDHQLTLHSQLLAYLQANLPAEPDSPQERAAKSTQAVSKDVPLGFTQSHDSGPTINQQNHNVELSEAGLDLKVDCSAAGATEASARAMLLPGAAAHVDSRSAAPRGALAHPTYEGSAHGFNCHSSIPLALDLPTTHMGTINSTSTAFVLCKGSEAGSPICRPEPQVTQTYASDSGCTLRAASGPTALPGSETPPNMSDSPSPPQTTTRAADTHNCDARVSGYHQPQAQLSPLNCSDLLYRLGALVRHVNRGLPPPTHSELTTTCRACCCLMNGFCCQSDASSV